MAVREAISSSGHGLPMARPMWFADPRNPDSWKVEDQYMIGSMVVVAPILQSNSTSRMVFLPPGSWIPCSHYHDSNSNSKGTHTNVYVTGNNSTQAALSWNDLLSGVHGRDNEDGIFEMELLAVLLTSISLTSPTPCFLKLLKMDH
jgi:Glycosyl hydrolases family 31